MQAGRLRHRVLLQRAVSTQSPITGAPITQWVDVAIVRAEVVAASAREFISAMATQSEVTTRITIRYRQGISNRDRILFRGKIYNIEGVLPDPVSGREYLTLPCSEGVNNG